MGHEMAHELIHELATGKVGLQFICEITQPIRLTYVAMLCTNKPS